MENPKTPLEQIEEAIKAEKMIQEGALFNALMLSQPPKVNQTIEENREEMLAVREREIMSNRLARTMASGNKIPYKKLTFRERLKLRLEINRQLPKGK